MNRTRAGITVIVGALVVGLTAACAPPPAIRAAECQPTSGDAVPNTIQTALASVLTTPGSNGSSATFIPEFGGAWMEGSTLVVMFTTGGDVLGAAVRAALPGIAVDVRQAPGSLQALISRLNAQGGGVSAILSSELGVVAQLPASEQATATRLRDVWGRAVTVLVGSKILSGTAAPLCLAREPGWVLQSNPPKSIGLRFATRSLTVNRGQRATAIVAVTNRGRTALTVDYFPPSGSPGLIIDGRFPLEVGGDPDQPCARLGQWPESPARSLPGFGSRDLPTQWLGSASTLTTCIAVATINRPIAPGQSILLAVSVNPEDLTASDQAALAAGAYRLTAVFETNRGTYKVPPIPLTIVDAAPPGVDATLVGP